MANITHICPSCGSNLIHKKESANFYCESCGNSYDYDFTLGQDIEAKAYEYLSQGEFNSAEEMFKLILAKDPSNEKAVIGSFMAHHGFSNCKEFNLKDLLKKRPFTDLSEYKSMVGEDGKAFFEYFESTSDSVVAIKEAKSKIPLLEKEIKESDDRCHSISNQAASYTVRYTVGRRSHFDMEPAPSLVFSSIFGVIALAILLIALSNDNPGNIAVVFVSGVALIDMGIHVFLSIGQLRTVNELNRIIRSLYTASHGKKKELTECNDAVSKGETNIHGAMLKARNYHKKLFDEDQGGK